ncbi:unnamed protein product [Darwinula stevensoni]|uniref:Uncharacterized protein n=1 Tax=Darwinula stevensoni TaxID=69355 RepID=A0A7R8XDV9_9CRUS|nr:unnamed protein product [Darwinula stevensoni]CAG0889067.1 unnamed protein product [Darwinula stevensoni]
MVSGKVVHGKFNGNEMKPKDDSYYYEDDSSSLAIWLPLLLLGLITGVCVLIWYCCCRAPRAPRTVTRTVMVTQGNPYNPGYSGGPCTISYPAQGNIGYTMPPSTLYQNPAPYAPSPPQPYLNDPPPYSEVTGK